MDVFTLNGISISQDWLAPIGVTLVLLSFYYFRVAYRRYVNRKRYTRADIAKVRAKAKRRL